MRKRLHILKHLGTLSYLEGRKLRERSVADANAPALLTLSQSEKIVQLTTAAGTPVEPIWATLLAKALDGKNVKEILTNIGSGAGGAAAAAPAAAAAGGAAAAADAPAAEEKKKEEEKEESDDDVSC